MFFEAPRPVTIVLCASVMEEVRVHQRRKWKRSTHLHEFLNFFYIQSIIYHGFGFPSSPRTALSSLKEHRARSPASYRLSVDVVIGQQADLGNPPIWVESILRRLGGGIVMGEESVYEDPATGSGGLRSLGMKRPHVVKPAGVGLWWSSVGVSCLRGRTLPQHRRAHRQASLHWRKMNVVS